MEVCRPQNLGAALRAVAAAAELVRLVEGFVDLTAFNLARNPYDIEGSLTMAPISRKSPETHSLNRINNEPN